MKENEKEEPPVTDADLARVAELDAKATKGPWLEEWDAVFMALKEYRTLCPRIARELIAARAQIEKLETEARQFPWEKAGKVERLQAQIAADAKKLKVARETLQYVKAKAVFPLGAIPDKPWSKIDEALTQLDAKP